MSPDLIDAAYRQLGFPGGASVMVDEYYRVSSRIDHAAGDPRRLDRHDR